MAIVKGLDVKAFGSLGGAQQTWPRWPNKQESSKTEDVCSVMTAPEQQAQCSLLGFPQKHSQIKV